MAPTNEGTPPPSALRPFVAMLARWLLFVHAALLVAQPFIAGTMLDGRSPDAQAWHLNIGMTLPTIGFVQVLVTLLAWRVSGWPLGAFTSSIAVWLLELAQFFIGYLGMPLAMHVPLGVLLVAAGVGMAYYYGRRPTGGAGAAPVGATTEMIERQASPVDDSEREKR